VLVFVCAPAQSPCSLVGHGRYCIAFLEVA
jgi:hypothetical protein